MSRGAGAVQRRIAEAFVGAPEKRFTVKELALLAYPDDEIGPAHLHSIRRALQGVAHELSLAKCRAGQSGQRGWRYVIGRMAG